MTQSPRSKRSRSTDRLRVALGCSAAIAVLTLIACSSGDAGPDARATEATASATTDARTAATPRAATYVKHAPGAIGLTLDSRGRLIYAEKDSGRIVRVARGRKTTLARIRVAGGGEAGLLGLAAGSGGKLWAYYTGSRAQCGSPTSGASSGGIRAHCVWRLRPSGGKLKADKLIFSAAHPSSAENHVGGALHFGPDGALYLGIGDLGENGDDTKGPGRAQDLSVPFGKILRLDPNRRNTGAKGNPTSCGNAANSAQRRISDRRIWACGLRNPFSFDWDTRGRLWVADVGDACDEINIVRAGVNYGWQPPRTDCAGSGAGRPVVKTSGTPSGVAVPKSPAAGSWRGYVFWGVYADSTLVRMNATSRRRARVGAGRNRTGWALMAGPRHLWMSDGQKISRIKLPGA